MVVVAVVLADVSAILVIVVVAVVVTDVVLVELCAVVFLVGSGGGVSNIGGSKCHISDSSSSSSHGCGTSRTKCSSIPGW